MTDVAFGVSAAVPEWITSHVEGATSPLTFDRIAGGRSNLTYRVDDSAGNSYILRRPPVGDHAAGAHDVVREANLLRGLQGRAPVPGVVAICDDTAVSGAAFVIQEYVDGLVVRGPADVRTGLIPDQRAAVGPALVDALANLHTVDPADTALARLADRRDHVARQLRRWHANWQQTATRAMPDLERAHAALADRIPAQRRTSVVHGDYRLDNCLLGRQQEVVAILDWELSTVGDPLTDLGQLLVYWAEPDDATTALFAPPTAEPGFSRRSELVELYCAASGDDVADLDFYVAFNWWKTACIVENVYSRMSTGAMGASDRDPESFAAQASRLAEAAWRHAQRLPA